MTDLFPSLPGESRLWLFALDRPLAGDALSHLKSGLESIFGNWGHKGHVYHAAWELIEERVLAVVEPAMAAAPSGCAIDGMLRKVHQVARDAGATLMDDASVLVRTQDGLSAIAKSMLKDALARGELDGSTPVVDLALFNLEQLRAGQLEKPLARTWIGRKYNVAVLA